MSVERLSDRAIEIIDDLHTERLDYTSEYLPLIDAANKLDAYEDTGLEPEEIEQLKGEVFGLKVDKQELEKYRAIGPIDRLRELVEADLDGRCFITPFVAMIEQSLSGGEMKPQRDQRFNGRYAVVYFDKEKWASPLVDICGKPYNREEAEERMEALEQRAAEAALKGESDGTQTDIPR